MKIAMNQKRDDRQIMRDFAVLRVRQLFAIAVTLFLLLFLALLHKRPDLFGEFSKNSLVAGQIVLIAAFIGFSAFNWRCPSCKRYLGTDINRRMCTRCGARLR
jgi:DMSO reductase anchor subunit